MIGILLSALALTMISPGAPVPEKTGYSPGDTAGDFSLKNVDETMVSLKDIQGTKGFIVIFTCNHCPYSVAYQDRIIAVHNKYSVLGYPVVAINPNDPEAYPEDSFAGMQKRAAEKGFHFYYLWDQTQEVARAYGAMRTPHVFLLQKQAGSLIVKYIGAIDDNAEDAAAAKNKYLENAVDRLLAGSDPSPGFTKAIGCSIKWKH